MISIIIPSYNRASIIQKTLDSILSQTFRDWECIIVDDHSVDNTRDIILMYSETDNRIHYYLNERKKGAQGARNTGLYHSVYDWVIFFDSDNYMYPEFLSELSKFITDNVDAIQCFSRVVDSSTNQPVSYFKWISNGNIHNSLFENRTYVDFNHVIFRKSKVLEIGGLDEDCPSMQEWDTNIRLSRTAKYITVEKVLVDYYVGAKDAISSDTRREVRGRLYILKKHLEEWKSKPISIRKYIYQIYLLIQRNGDDKFREESYRELCSLVPWANSYIIRRDFCQRIISFMKNQIKSMLK